MNENQLREQRNRLRSEKIYHARILEDVFPNVESVEICASVLFESGVSNEAKAVDLGGLKKSKRDFY